MERRDFTKGLLATVTSFVLMDSLFAFNTFSNTIKPITQHWLIDLNTYCSDLRKESITPLEWQHQIEQLYQKIELKDILEFIDFNKLQKGFQFPDLGVNTKTVKFPKLDGLPEQTVFTKKYLE